MLKLNFKRDFGCGIGKAYVPSRVKRAHPANLTRHMDPRLHKVWWAFVNTSKKGITDDVYHKTILFNPCLLQRLLSMVLNLKIIFSVNKYVQRKRKRKKERRLYKIVQLVHIVLGWILWRYKWNSFLRGPQTSTSLRILVFMQILSSNP